MLKGDVIQTGGDGSVGVTFIDGSVFSLSAGARIAINKFLNKTKKQTTPLSSIWCRERSISWPGMAKTGSMIGTPVATMGIRGTAMHTVIARDGTVQAYVIDEDKDEHLVDILRPEWRVPAGCSTASGRRLDDFSFGRISDRSRELQKSPEQRLRKQYFSEPVVPGRARSGPNKTDPDDRTNVQSI